jgi:thiamine kinase-like enzyme
MRGLLSAIKIVVTQLKLSLETPLWRVTQITGHLNHRVYHCQSVHNESLNLMAKVFDHTDEKFAWREYSALRALWNLKYEHVSPIPLLLLESYIAPDTDVLITEWIHATNVSVGETLNKLQWVTTLHTLAEVHQITPETTRVRLPDAVNSIRHPIDFLQTLDNCLEVVEQRSTETNILKFIRHVLSHLKATIPHHWAFDVPRTLIHGDWQLQNFALTDGVVRFFDWEMAGWSDPAMDIGLLLSHESFAEVTAYDKNWLIETYRDISKDDSLPTRVNLYIQLLDIKWLIDALYRLTPEIADEQQAKNQARIELYRERIEQRYDS